MHYKRSTNNSTKRTTRHHLPSAILSNRIEIGSLYLYSVGPFQLRSIVFSFSFLCVSVRAFHVIYSEISFILFIYLLIDRFIYGLFCDFIWLLFHRKVQLILFAREEFRFSARDEQKMKANTTEKVEKTDTNNNVGHVQSLIFKEKKK